MARLQLSSKTRTDFRKSVTKQLRREGQIPATIYGKDQEPMSLAIPAEEFAQLLKTPGGRLSVIDLSVEGIKSKKPIAVMIQDIQRDPLTKQVVHVDLHGIKMDVKVHARVPVRLVGEAPGVKQGGILEHLTREIEIEALPDNMPSHIDVDVSGLELGQNIHVGDLTLPDNTELLHTSTESIVATVRQPIVRTEEVAAAPEAAPAAEAPAEASTEEA